MERLSRASFGTGGLYLEKFVANARHIEVQIFGDGRARDRARRARLLRAAPQSEGDRGDSRAGLVGRRATARQRRPPRQSRQLSIGRHGGVHLRQGHRPLLLPGSQHPPPGGARRHRRGHRHRPGRVDGPPARPARLPPSRCGHSIQVRIYAEDPAKNFQPSAGHLTQVVWPADARVETWVEPGTEVTPYYDPMLAKIIVRGDDARRGRSQDCAPRWRHAHRRHRDQSRIPAPGLRASRLRRRRHLHARSCAIFRTAASHRCARGGHPDHRPGLSRPPRLLARRRAALGPHGFALVPPGQPPGGQSGSAAGLEITVTGPTLRFTCDAIIALTGADFGAPHCRRHRR